MITEPTPPAASLADFAARKRDLLAYISLALGALFLTLTIVWALKWYNGREQAPTANDPATEEVSPGDPKKKELPAAAKTSSDFFTGTIWSGLLALLTAGFGAWTLSRTPEPGNVVHESRVALMVAGGVAGALTALLGFALAWRWQRSILLWINQGDTGEAKWVLAALCVFFAGLALLFFSMQIGRAEERTSSLIRRLIYGTNAALSGLLLLLVLVVVNIGVFLKLPDNVITTASAFKGLSPESREFLRTITQPVHIYLAMPENFLDEEGYTGLYADCRSLLRTCEEENSNIKVTYLSPVTGMDEIRRVQEQLEIPKDSRNFYGMMIGFGESQQPSAFIPVEPMLQMSPEGRLVFQGEARLMTELNFLSGGAKRPVIYFTQSNNEPSITGPTENNTRSCVEIVQYLKERKFDVRPLLLEPGKKIDISDGSLILIPAPRTPFRPEQVELLQEYLAPSKMDAKPGKIIAFLPAVPAEGGNVAATGLEAFLSDHGIRVETKRMLSLPGQGFSPVLVMGTVAPILRRDRHVLASNFPFEFQLRFGNVRPIFALPSGSPRLLARPLFTNFGGYAIYQDTRYDSSPEAIEKQLIKDRQLNSAKTEVEMQVTTRPEPFAAFAVEREQNEQGIREIPRLVVVGTDWLIDDAVLKQASLIPDNYKKLMGLLVEYTRERPEGMKIEPRALGTFSLPKETNEFTLYYMPAILVILGIFGLGVGVWVARRR